MNFLRALVVAALLLGGGAARALEAGAAKLRITLPGGIPLGGVAERQGRAATGEHDPIWTRCLYLDDGESSAYLISVDLNYIPRILREGVVAAAGEFAAKESIFLTATNTYNGPGGLDRRLALRALSGRYHPELLDLLVSSIVTTMSTAREEKRRATLGYAVSRQTVLSQHERGPDGTVDGQLGVIRVDDADGRAISILANFAARPNLVPPSDQYRFSSDFPGVYYQVMDELTDPGCVALFMNGATGDQVPGNPENQTGWAHVESIGRLLAESAKAVANDMTFRDVTLKSSYREVSLPPSLSEAHLPTSTILQTLEIDGLLLVFVPGEPGAALGLALRRQALAAGHRAQFTVGLANDYLKAFVSRADYALPEYASARHLFGPAFESWLYSEVASMLDMPDPVPPRPQPDEAMRETVEGGIVMTFAGDGYQRGYQRGASFRTRVQTLYRERVVEAIRDGERWPVQRSTELWPWFLDPTAVALPEQGIKARPLLAGMSDELFSEVEGFAAATELPFDAAWLLQNAEELSGTRDVQPSMSTIFAAMGERSSTAGPIVGHNLDWNHEEAPVVSVIDPDEGRRFVQVGFDWQLGTFTGMNDAGVVIAVERDASLGTSESMGIPVTFLIRNLLQTTGTYDEALARLTAAVHIRGVRVLLVARGAETWRGAIVTFGNSVTARSLENGLLLGVIPEEAGGDGPTARRYRQVSGALVGEKPLVAGDVEAVLSRGGGAITDMTQVWNSKTRYSVVMLPASRAIRVAFPTVSGEPGPYTEIQLSEGGAR